MTIYKDNATYRRPTPAECEKYGLDNPIYWYIETMPDGREGITHDSVSRLADQSPDDMSPIPIVIGTLPIAKDETDA